MPALRTQMEIMCRVGAHAMQATPAQSQQPKMPQLWVPRAGFRWVPCRPLELAELPCKLGLRAGGAGAGSFLQQLTASALRRLSARSLLQRLILRDSCPANSNGDHVPNRCPCNTGYAGTGSVVTTVLSTAARALRCLPCKLIWRPVAE